MRFTISDGGDFLFRRGPVPGLLRFRPSALPHYRRFHTAAEIRDNHFVAHDPDCIAVGLRVRPARNPGSARIGLPHIWDDLPIGRRGDCWKHYRRHQSRRRGIEGLRADAG